MAKSVNGTKSIALPFFGTIVITVAAGAVFWITIIYTVLHLFIR